MLRARLFVAKCRCPSILERGIEAAPVANIWRGAGISDATCYNRKKKMAALKQPPPFNHSDLQTYIPLQGSNYGTSHKFPKKAEGDQPFTEWSLILLCCYLAIDSAKAVITCIIVRPQGSRGTVIFAIDGVIAVIRPVTTAVATGVVISATAAIFAFCQACGKGPEFRDNRPCSIDAKSKYQAQNRCRTSHFFPQIMGLLRITIFSVCNLNEAR